MFERRATYRAALMWSLIAVFLLWITTGPLNIVFFWVAAASLGWLFIYTKDLYDGVAKLIWAVDQEPRARASLTEWPRTWPFAIALVVVPLAVGFVPFRALWYVLSLVLWGVIYYLWALADSKAREHSLRRRPRRITGQAPEEAEEEPTWSRVSLLLDEGFESPITGTGVAALLMFLAVETDALPDPWSYIALALMLIYLTLAIRHNSRRSKHSDKMEKRRADLGLPPVAPFGGRWLVLGLVAAVVFTFAAIFAEPPKVWFAVAAFGLWVFPFSALAILWSLADERVKAEIAKAEVEAAEKERKRKCEEILARYARIFLPVHRAQLEKLVKEGVTPDELEEGILAALKDPDTGVALGDTWSGERLEPVFIDQERRSRHVYVLGKTGAGKSNFILTLILQDIRAGRGLAVVTPDPDLLREILGQMPQSRYDDVIYFNPGDDDRPVSFNPLELGPKEDLDLRVDENVAAFKRVFGMPGQRMEEILWHTFYALLERPGSTLLDVDPLLDRGRSAVRDEVIARSRDPHTVHFFRDVYHTLPKDAHLPITTRLNRMTRPRALRSVLCRPSTLDFARIMDERRIALFDLSESIGENVSQLLGQLVISKFQMALLARANQPEAARVPFFLFVDEFQTFAGTAVESYRKLLDRARKYRLGLVLAHQQTGQLSGELLKDILGNVMTTVCFTTGVEDASRLSRELGVRPQDLVSLPTGRAYIRIGTAVHQLAVPLVRTPDGATGRAETVMARSRANWGCAIETKPTGHPPPSPPVERPPTKAASASTPAMPPPPRRAATASTPSASAAQSPPAPAPAPMTPPPPAAESQAPSEPMPPAPATAGRGGAQHKYLQELIKRWGEANGWGVIIEQGILDGLGIVDVALAKGDLRVACEISVTTTPEHEIANVQKCLAAGFEWVAAVAVDRRKRTALSKALSAALDEGTLEQIRCVTADELFAFLEELDAKAAATEGTVKGYKVRVKYRPVDEAAKAEKKAAISQVILKALKRLKGKEE